MCRAAGQEADRLIAVGSIITVVDAQQTARKNRGACAGKFGSIQSNTAAGATLCIGDSAILHRCGRVAVLHADIGDGFLSIVGQLIAQVGISSLDAQYSFGIVGRQVHIQRNVTGCLQQADAVGFTLTRLQEDFRNIIVSVALDSGVLVLLIEQEHAVCAVITFPSIQVVGTHLAKSGHGGVALGGLTVAGLDLEIACLNGLGIIAGAVIGHIHCNPLCRIGGEGVQVHGLAAYAAHHLIEHIGSFLYVFRRNAVVLGGRGKANLLNVVHILGNGVLIPVQMVVFILLNQVSDISIGCNGNRCYSDDDGESGAADKGANLGKACQDARCGGCGQGCQSAADRHEEHRALGSAYHQATYALNGQSDVTAGLPNVLALAFLLIELIFAGQGHITGCFIGKAHHSFVLHQGRIDAHVQVNRLFILGSFSKALVIIGKVGNSCTGAGNHFQHAAIGQSSKFAVRQDRHQRIQSLLVSSLCKGQEEVLQRTCAVAILFQFLEENLVNGSAGHINACHVLLFCGHLALGDLAVFPVVALGGLVHFLKDTHCFHRLVALGIELEDHKKLLGTLLQLGFVCSVSSIRIIGARGRQLGQPVSACELDAHGQRLDHGVEYRGIAEQEHLGQLVDGHLAVHQLITQTILLCIFRFTVNNTEEVQRHICLLGSNVSFLIGYSEFLNQIVQFFRHLRKRALLCLEGILHVGKRIAALGVHQLDIIDCLCGIGGCLIAQPNTVMAGAFIQVMIKESISIDFQQSFCFFFGLCLSHFNGLDINLCRYCLLLCGKDV